MTSRSTAGSALSLGAAVLLSVVLVPSDGFSREAGLEPPPADLTAEQVAQRADDNMRSDKTFFEARMRVESPRLSGPRTVRFTSWEERGRERSFIRIHEPAKDTGTGFLKRESNLWMYVPRVERTIRIPPSMMLQSWMGSDFTNDDLVRESSEVDDYDHAWVGVEPAFEPAGGGRAYVVEYLPHEDAPVVWSRIRAWVAADTFAPLRQEFFDEDGEKLRVIVFAEHREVNGRMLPHRWSLTPLDKSGHRTEIEVIEMRFDAEIDESIFTKRNLEKEVRR